MAHPVLNPRTADSDLSSETLARLRSGLIADPDSFDKRLAYTHLLIEMGEYREALVQIEETSRLALRCAVPPQGSSHSTAGEPPRLISPRDQVAAVRQLGFLLDRSNQIDGLRQLLAAAKDAGIAPEALGYLNASLALRDGRPEKAERLLLQDREVVDAELWHRLMTKIADALGDADRAFAAADEMNRAAPGYNEWRWRSARYRAGIRLTAQVVTAEWALRIRPPQPRADSRAPAFLVGIPRSGTTLLDTFLMGHPQTCVVEEGRMLEKATGVISTAVDADWPSDLIARARDAYFDELSCHVEPNFTGLVIDKHPLNMLRLAVLNALFPDAKVIFAQRHPCDVVLSGFMQCFALNHAMACFLDLADAADFYDAAMTMWTRTCDAFRRPIHSIVYERLIVDPSSELRPALKFLGLEWRDELLDHQATAKSRGAIISASYDQVTQPLSRASSGRWRRYRTKLDPVLPTLLPWAKRLGYGD
jgi:hypothetical protein